MCVKWKIVELYLNSEKSHSPRWEFQIPIWGYEIFHSKDLARRSFAYTRKVDNDG